MNLLSEDLRLAFRVLFLIAIGCISYLALNPSPPDIGISLWDKLSHFLAFLVLAILADHSFDWDARGSYRQLRAGGFIWIGLSIYGCAIEIAQSFLDQRYFEWFDILANTLGIMAYILIIFLRHQIRRF